MTEFGIPKIPFFGVDIVSFAIDFLIAYALILAVSLTLNLEAGYAGIPNFGKVLFVAGGAAIAGAVAGRGAVLILGINTYGDYNTHIALVINQANLSLGDNFPLSMQLLLAGLLIGAVVGGALGLVFSIVTTRQGLREDYLGMLLLAAAQFFQIFLRNYSPLIGGTQGILVPDVFAWASPCPSGQVCRNFHGLVIVPTLLSLTGPEVRDVAILIVVAIFAVLVYLYAESIGRSPLGRTLRAVRDDEAASRALGKNDVAIRRNVLIIASAISGMAGALITFQVSTVGPDTWSRLTWTFYPWLIVIIGGAANNVGVGVGAFVFSMLLKGIDEVKFRFQPIIPFNVNWLYYLSFAALLILFLFFRPDGMVPEEPSETLPYQELVNIVSVKPEKSREPQPTNAEPNTKAAGSKSEKPEEDSSDQGDM